MGNFRPFGEIRGEKLEVLVDGARVALVDWDEAFGLNKPGFGGFSGQLKTIDVKVPVSAGPHRVGVTFLATNYAPGLDMNRAFERSTIETGGLPGYTFYPHIGSVRVDGPYDASGAGDTPSRERILTCTPSAPTEERPCAERILTTLARAGYRGMQTDEDVATLLAFYDQGRADGDFESGIEIAVERLLADPKFIYRAEHEPADGAPGSTYRVSDLELASRLSFFLWSSIPDDELLTLAEQGKLADSAVLEKQVRRMLADPRSEALTANFAGQWLDLRALEGHVPVAALFPDFDDNLRQSYRRETELLFDSLISRGPADHRAAHGGLHVRRTNGSRSLRDPGDLRQPLPARDARARARRAPRLARQGQFACDLVTAGPHVARDSRLLGAAESSRRAAAAAAAECARAQAGDRGRDGQQPHALDCASRWNCIAAIPRARAATS